MRKYVMIWFLAGLVSVSITIPAHATSHFCPYYGDSPFWQYLITLDHSIAEVSVKDRAAYLKEEEKFSAQGDGHAMCFLGIDRFYGEHRKQDYHIAADLFRRADKRFCPTVFVYLGVMNADGLGMERNADRAQYWFRSLAPVETELAKTRSSDDTAKDGDSLDYYEIIKRPDMTSALEWWRTVSSSTDAEELYNLGLNYLKLSDGTDAYYLAERLLAMAAKAGHLEAALIHGRNTVSCRFSPSAGRGSNNLLKPFADKGHAEAAHLIGRWFASRPPFLTNYRRQAFRWFARAKELGVDTDADMKALEKWARRTYPK
jgi:TPR repeat protein